MPSGHDSTGLAASLPTRLLSTSLMNIVPSEACEKNRGCIYSNQHSPYWYLHHVLCTMPFWTRFLATLGPKNLNIDRRTTVY